MSDWFIIVMSIIGAIFTFFSTIWILDWLDIPSKKQLPKNKILLKGQFSYSKRYLYVLKSKDGYFLLITKKNFKNTIEKARCTYEKYKTFKEAKKFFYAYIDIKVIKKGGV